MREDPGEAAVGAGVGVLLEEDALGGRGGLVGAEAHPRQGDGLCEDLLGLAEVDAVSTREPSSTMRSMAVISGEVPRFRGDLGEGLAGVLLEIAGS